MFSTDALISCLIRKAYDGTIPMDITHFICLFLRIIFNFEIIPKRYSDTKGARHIEAGFARKSMHWFKTVTWYTNHLLFDESITHFFETLITNKTWRGNINLFVDTHSYRQINNKFLIFWDGFHTKTVGLRGVHHRWYPCLFLLFL